jgi:tetratricopeptide (TPR) repeat protein
MKARARKSSRGRSKTKPLASRPVHHHYRRALQLEASDAGAALAAYEACLRVDCSHLEARINLGRLLHLQGLLDQAETVYREIAHPSAVLHFNLGVLMEDMRRDADAIEAYRFAILYDPGMADAHLNLSILYERSGEAQAAFRHLLTFRRLLLIAGQAPTSSGNAGVKGIPARGRHVPALQSK